MIFFTEGIVGLGYEINKVKKIHHYYKRKGIIGGYEMIFKQRCDFLYACLEKLSGYFVRNENLEDIFE